MTETLHISKQHIIIFVVALLLIVLAVISFAIPLPYNATEAYTEREPYTKIENYWDTIPYTAQECDAVNLKSVIEWGETSSVCVNQICDASKSVCVDTNWYGGCIRYEDRCTHNACTKYRKYCSLKINNIDDAAGTWQIEGSSWNYDTKKAEFVNTIDTYVQPTKTELATWDYLYDAGESMGCIYNIKNTPTKSVCRDVIKQQDVQKSREITAYRNVEKTRTVTKYATLFRRWTGRVQWYYQV